MTCESVVTSPMVRYIKSPKDYIARDYITPQTKARIFTWYFCAVDTATWMIVHQWYCHSQQ